MYRTVHFKPKGEQMLLLKELLEKNDFRIICMAWNCKGMDDGENQPLYFTKLNSAVTFGYNIEIPFSKQSINVWGEPEIVQVYRDSDEFIGHTIGNDLTFEYKDSKRDHHLLVNKSIRKTFALYPIINTDFILETTDLITGIVQNKENEFITDRWGCYNDLKQLCVINHINELFGTFDGITLISSGTVKTIKAEPIYLQMGNIYHCYIEGLGTLSNKIFFEKD